MNTWLRKSYSLLKIVAIKTKLFEDSKSIGGAPKSNLRGEDKHCLHLMEGLLIGLSEKRSKGALLPFLSYIGHTSCNLLNAILEILMG